jgi:hypothetical protein
MKLTPDISSPISHVHFSPLRLIQRIRPSLKPCVTFHTTSCAGGPPITGYHQLLIQYILTYPSISGGCPLNLKPVDVPCCGDEGPT